ncbi:ethylene-responsive nuclear protein / ethylene-regulated nuclear protein (ERT2) [Tasmannia lanceolata]|uniref:ethylene-responsive nuclear protein / ethylene-regulated nuclear protein (ERT2) n=1 Tax=Tasmannia lanceolata TaxID=3420 RepID=UPI0040648A2D
MPLLWKKAKIGRISRFVSDLRSKRSRSLVVQTGFPTSLADLIVQNRDRLKKSSKKKLDPSLTPIPSPTPSNSSLSEENSTIFPSNSNESFTTESSNEFSPPIPKNVEISIPPDRRFSMFLFKVFFVLALGLGTKKMALVITVSAFVLFFVEFVGKCLVFWLEPCADAKRSLAGALDSNRQDCALGKETQVNESVKETKVIESDLDMFESRTIPELIASCWKSEIMMKNRDNVKDDVRNRRAGSGNFKAKLLKTFVPKKFRSAKGGKISSRVVSDCGIEEQVGGREEEDGDDDEEEEDDDEGIAEKIVICDEKSLVELEDVDVIRENVCSVTMGSWKHLVFFLVVLFGLVGGRVIALVLTIVCYLLWKSAQTLWVKLKKC